MYAKKSNTQKAVLVLLAVVLLIGCTIGATLAWLADKTEPVVNTFTTSDVSIKLSESEGLNLKMVPGQVIAKDPKVTVVAGSEACYVFVKVDAANGAVLAGEETVADYITYAIADAWIELEDGVYYCVVDAATAEAGAAFNVLKDNQVQVLPTVTKEMMTENFTAPTLTFTAYAIQKAGFEGKIAEAWAAAQGLQG